MAEVAPLPRHRDRRAALVLARAFVDDPAWLSIGPRWRPHRLAIAVLVHYVELRLARRRGAWLLAASSGSDLVAVMVAYPRGEDPPPKWVWGPRILPWLLAGPIPGSRSARLGAAIDGLRPREPHVYCWLLAATPETRGVGAQVMRAMIERANATGRPMYLEATAPHLVLFYGMLGFQEIGVYTMRTGAPLTRMWRPPGDRARLRRRQLEAA